MQVYQIIVLAMLCMRESTIPRSKTELKKEKLSSNAEAVYVLNQTQISSNVELFHAPKLIQFI